MAAPFGFSAGDFIAALKLVNNVIHALRDGGGAGEEYRELIHELYILETALLEVKRVELDDEQHAQRVALQQAASQCHRTIDEFWRKIQKYQPHLRSEGSGSKVKDGWRKTQWALCKKDDVFRFRARLRGHTGSINILLMTVQMNSTAIDRRRNDDTRRTLGARLQQNTFAYLGILRQIAKGVNDSVRQGQELLLSTATVIRTNVQIFQLVLGLQNHVLSLPSQVERQQPVTFFDACGRVFPFHLEFINSAEAFLAVLRVRFKHIGLVKFDRGEYVMKETATDREIDLSRPWDQCFLPGQKADMSMVFYAAQGNTCPGCHRYCGDASKAEVVCVSCGMTVHRITETEEKEKDTTVDDTMNDVSKAGPPKAARKRKRSVDNDEEVARFRRHERSAMNYQVPKGMPNPTEMPGQESLRMKQGSDSQQPSAMGNYHTRIQAQIRGMPAANGHSGNHVLADYQMQLMLLEQQNRKRLLLARQAPLDNMNEDHMEDG